MDVPGGGVKRPVNGSSPQRIVSAGSSIQKYYGVKGVERNV
ncbi:hypothetical protein [Alicyclobacillus ferrooxydans]|nr:hypothetical protein [Alicyclobacillus ferrooxydans]